MAITIYSNIASLTAQRRLGDSTAALRQSFERLSSGLRINRASDDAAGLAIADSLNADSRLYSQATRNVNDGLSVLSIADGALEELSGIATRISELAEQASNGVYSSQQRAALDTEAQALALEYRRVIEATKFNGQNVLDGTMDNVTLQVGIDAAATSQLALGIDSQNNRFVGDGTFESEVSYATLENFNAMRAGDFNNDGYLDLIGTANSSGGTVIFAGNGDGTFAAPRSYGASSVGGLATYDFNGDGNLDYAMGQGTYSMRLGDGDLTFTGGTPIANTHPFEGTHSRVGDFNGDGNIDIMNVYSSGAAFFNVYLGNGDGTFSTFQSGGLLSPRDFELVDVNNDSQLDLVTGYRFSTTFQVLLGNADGSFAAPLNRSAGDSNDSVAYGDFNGDGEIDIVFDSEQGDGTSNLRIAYGNGDATFSAPQFVASGGNSGVNSVEVRDMNGDGFDDIARASNDGVEIYLGNGDGTFQATLTATMSKASATYLLMADFSGDGVDDIIAAHGGQSMSVLIANSTAAAGMQQFSLQTAAEARSALDQMTSLIAQVSESRGRIGATQSRLNVALNNLATQRENVQAAESQIRDADVASEAAELTRLQILQQAGAAVLGQANLQPQIALRLLGGI